jgi:hypothetical protein
MLDELGLSFLPQGGQGGATGPGGNRLEDILQVLSFRLPRVLGARPIAPAQLLNAQGGGGGDPLAGAVVQNVLKSILGGAPGGQGMDAGAPSGMERFLAAGGGAPSQGKPRVIPIQNPPVDDPPQDRTSIAAPRSNFDSDYNNVDQQLRRGQFRMGGGPRGF